MKLTLMVESTQEMDGEESRVIIQKDDLTTVEDFLNAYEGFMRATGFTYIKVVGAEADDGHQYWSGF